MGHGKRYSDEPKLNLKKVFAVIIAIIVIVMFVLIIRNILRKAGNEKVEVKKYFSVFSDNKWGVIDQTGEYIIIPAYENMVIVPNEDKDVFLCMYNINDESGTYQTKAINSKNEELFTGYNQIEAISNSDSAGNLYYFENILKVQKNGKYGLIDFDGNVILEIEYDNIKALENENKILVEKNGMLGVANENGNLILKPNYTNVLKTGNNLFVVKNGEKTQVVDKKGTVVLEDVFDEVEQILNYDTEGIIYVKNGKYGVMKSNGEVIINPEYNYLKQVKENTYIAKNDKGFGIIDGEKNILLDFKYVNIGYSKKADIYIADINDTESTILDNSFTEKVTGIVNVYEEEGYFKIRIGEENKYYNFKFEEKTNIDVLSQNNLFVSKQNDKYGFIDKEGNIVVDYIYDEAMEQNEFGYAAVKLNGVWGSIDKDGNTIINPTYNLEENIKIDFIGKWHFGKYTNMNYYTNE